MWIGRSGVLQLIWRYTDVIENVVTSFRLMKFLHRGLTNMCVWMHRRAYCIQCRRCSVNSSSSSSTRLLMMSLMRGSSYSWRHAASPPLIGSSLDNFRHAFSSPRGMGTREKCEHYKTNKNDQCSLNIWPVHAYFSRVMFNGNAICSVSLFSEVQLISSKECLKTHS